ncbi:MAG: CDC27 family protein [Sulfurimonas sp.]|nr:CDC27 family protein [Sulfurimonas sp.]
MLNINELEIKHKKYKLKSYTPYLTIFISLTVISISAIFLLNYNSVSTVDTNSNTLINKKSLISKETKPRKNTNDDKAEKQETIEQTAKIKKETIIVEKQIDKPQEEVIVIKEEKLKLSPSLNFMQKIQSDALPYYEDNTKIQKKPVVKKTIPAKVEQTIITKIKEEKKVQEPKLIVEKKNTINIKRKNDNDDIRHVIKRFKVNNNPALSLFVAKKYYQLGEYDKAYNYALITNEINNDIEASWIVFAKSLVKLQKRDMAIKTLKKYISHSHSSQAKLLLDEILSGKFK